MNTNVHVSFSKKHTTYKKTFNAGENIEHFTQIKYY